MADGQQNLWTRDFVLIMGVNLFIFVGFQMLMPTLPVYAVKLGGADTMAGLVVGIFTISSVLTRPLAGRALDIYGRKGIYLLGLAIFVVSVLAYNWVPTLLVLMLFRFVHGVGWGASGTAASTIASDIIPKPRLGEGMGYFGLTSTLAMAIAPALGLFLEEHYGFSSLFFISALSATMAVLLALLLRYRDPVSKNIPRPGQQGSRGRVGLLERTALRPAAVVFLVTMTYGAVVSFLALYAKDLGVANVGPFFSLYALTLMLIRPLSGRLADRKGFAIIMVPGLVGIVAALLVIAGAHSLLPLLVAAVLYGFGFGAVQPSLQAMAVMHVPSFRRGAANATFLTGFDLGIGIGSMLWGGVAAAVGYSRMYLVAIIPAVLALIIFLVQNSNRPRSAAGRQR